MNRKSWKFLLFDILILIAAFLFCIWLKPSSKKVYLQTYTLPFLYFFTIWISSSLLFRKYSIFKKNGFAQIFRPILISNLISIFLVLLFLFGFQLYYYSRLIVFGTILITVSLELIFTNILYWITLTKDEPETIITKKEKQFKTKKPPKEKVIGGEISKKEQILQEEVGKDISDFIAERCNINSNKTLIIETTTRFNILNQANESFKDIINLHRANDIRFINKFFEAINKKLILNGHFIGCVETKDLRKERILKKYMPIFNYIYYFFDFIIKRLFPKFGLTKGIYFFLTKGRNRVLSKAETLGRLYSCGFKVIEDTTINNLLFFHAVKITGPSFDTNPTYGPLIRLKRVGKNGKIIKVYKMRTMHPYSEYLQEYIHENYALKEGGKFDNDFRITTAGKIMRKLWIDELPMILNLLKGDLKIIGVRPISNHYFNLYSKKLQNERIKTTPGLVPPFYVDLPKTLEEIEASEMRYLKAYQKHPIITDIKYFWLAAYNILIKGARSS